MSRVHGTEWRQRLEEKQLAEAEAADKFKQAASAPDIIQFGEQTGVHINKQVECPNQCLGAIGAS